MFIYLLYHKSTNHCYVGTTSKFKARFVEHNSQGGWKAILVLETRKHVKEICKFWKESDIHLEAKVKKGLKLAHLYNTKVYMDYDKYEMYETKQTYTLPKSLWKTILNVE